MVSEDVMTRVTSYIQHQATKSHDGIAALVSDSQARFLDVVGGLSDEQASRPEAEGEWCVRQLVRHVVDAETSVAGLVAELARGQNVDAGRRGAGAMIEDDGGPYAGLVARLREANERMIVAIRELPAEPDLELKAPHPFCGPLNCREWAAFQRVHDADHIQHAQKILAATTSSG